MGLSPAATDQPNLGGQSSLLDALQAGQKRLEGSTRARDAQEVRETRRERRGRDGTTVRPGPDAGPREQERHLRVLVDGDPWGAVGRRRGAWDRCGSNTTSTSPERRG